MSIADIGLTSNTRARVTVTLEITVNDNWSGRTEINQVVGQAKDSARQKLFELMRNGARIIGEPQVTMIMVDAKE